MELKNFVVKVLGEVIQGVKEVQSIASEEGAEVNPQVKAAIGVNKTWGYHSVSGSVIDFIEFDVALTVTEGDDVRAGIRILPLNIGGAVREGQSTVSRIKFKIPVTLPLQNPYQAPKAPKPYVAEGVGFDPLKGG